MSAVARSGVAAVAADMEHRLAVTIHGCLADYWRTWRQGNPARDHDMPALELQVGTRPWAPGGHPPLSCMWAPALELHVGTRP